MIRCWSEGVLQHTRRCEAPLSLILGYRELPCLSLSACFRDSCFLVLRGLHSYPGLLIGLYDPSNLAAVSDCSLANLTIFVLRATYHLFTEKQRIVYLFSCGRSTSSLFKADESLSSHPDVLLGTDVDNLAELRENDQQSSL